MSKTHLGTQYDDSLLLEEDVREPRQYKVLLHNDDYTSMEFVIFVLIRVFRKSTDEATSIMLAVHEEGIGICGVYTHEIAETKVAQVYGMAREAGFPLRCTLEESE